MITRYSEVSRTHALVIDNFNSATDCCVYVERILFNPVYRVVKRSRNGRFVHECFTLSLDEANKYFSQLMAEKLELF